jgi:cyclopropane fatty-acyl-phospholipid synthase-like methyltransferase
MKTLKKTGTRKNNDGSQAAKADIHQLYEDSVQCVEAEIDFVDQTYKKLRGRTARTLREDFCGTMNTSCEWVRRRKDNQAWCVDLDRKVLAWGKTHKISQLERPQQERITIIREDVRTVQTPPVDIVLAMNFSYWIFKTREAMVGYFRHVHASLADKGVFFLDSFGGHESYKEMLETTRYKGFTYVWDQNKYNPITGDATFHIHFRFPDGSAIDKAFSYEWRMWSLPELTEMLSEAGFRPAVYWEGTGKDGHGNGIFSKTTRGEADASWIAYIVAEK